MRYKHRVSIEELSQLFGRRRQYAAKFLAALNAEQFDAILCPPDALPALKHGSSFYVSGCSISYPGLYSLLGMPAGVVAATRVRPDEESDRPKSRDLIERAACHVETGSTGLPVGVQVVARHWREDVVLAVMAVLEDHFRRRPGYPAWPPM
jgi:fatty acid amide hydrolase